MPYNLGFRRSSALLVALTIGTSLASAPETETPLYIFRARNDGAFPAAGLVQDKAGNLYGTTADGLHTYGTIFELSPKPKGGYSFKVIYALQNLMDGAIPLAPLTFDSQGNLYGTASTGAGFSQGAVFEISPDKHGGWYLSNSYDFNGTFDGGHPLAGVVLDKAGNIYGTTSGSADDSNAGTVFRLTPTKTHGWQEKTLHAFKDGADGGYPHSGVTLDKNGDLYGTVPLGNEQAPVGLVYKLHEDGGHWHDTVLYDFKDGADGGIPQSGVIFDQAGNLYGTTTLSPNGFDGGVFELSPPTGDAKRWHLTSLFQFTDTKTGYYPESGLIFDKAGNLYGATPGGGEPPCKNGCGVIYKLTPTPSGPWEESVLDRFTGHRLGATPNGPLLLSQDGTLYGTTANGGKGAGVVFSLAKSH